MKEVEAYKVEIIASEETETQETAFAALRQSLGQPDVEAARRVLAEREQVEPESDLDLQVIETLHSHQR